MKLPLILSLTAFSVCVGEPVSTVLDPKGRATCDYKIDAIFPEGILVKTGGQTVWLDVPYAQTAVRNAIAQNQNSPPKPEIAPAESAPTPAPRRSALPPGMAYPVSAQVNGATFDLRSARHSNLAAGQSIRLAQEKVEMDEAIRNIPGADSGKELPWEFVRNEVAMWMIWFTTADESNPQNAKVNEYIRQQNFPPMLLYRLLVKPWLPRHKG